MSKASLKIVDPVDQSIQLTDHQQHAYDEILDWCQSQDTKMMVLCGYAGTGKTTLVSELVKEKAETGIKIAIAAPTNKAVKVLKEKIQEDKSISFGSIHSFLGLKLQEQENGNQKCTKDGDSKIYQYNLVIIDECSMISSELFKHIALQLEPHNKVLFVGDPAQLPPVGEKEDSPVFRMVQSQVMLSQVVRQAKENPIIKLSMTIREYIERNESITPMQIAESIPPGAMDVCLVAGGENTMAAWAIEEQKQGVDCRIIAYTNAQVRRYNQVIHDALFEDSETKFCSGERVVVSTQTHVNANTNSSDQSTLFTSEELEVISCEDVTNKYWKDTPCYELKMKRDDGSMASVYVVKDDNQFQVQLSKLWSEWRDTKAEAKALQATNAANWIEKHEEAKKLSKRAWSFSNSFADIRHCYAITTHKSQGSTFDVALVDYSNLSRMRSSFEFNRALYVAATRPKNHLAIVV